MSNSTRSPRELMDAIGGRWPASGGEAWNEAVEARLAVLAESQPEPVVRRLFDAMADPASEPFARALASALQVANTVGLKAAGWLGEERLHLVDSEGRSLALGVVGIDVLDNPSGDLDALAELRRALDGAFGDRRYVLWLRKPLPATIDAASIGRAVTLWLSAIDRGEWHGNHAIYEDDAVELELVLTNRRGSLDRSSEILRLEPVTALERLSDVDRMLVDRASVHDEEHPDVPLVFAVGASAPWRLPRGFPEQLLYGTADWTRSTTEPSTYEAAFHSSGRALFSDPLAANIASVWWMEPVGDDPLGLRTWSHENPWHRCAWVPEPPPGARFYKAGEDKGSRGRTVDVMRWSAPWRGGR